MARNAYFEPVMGSAPSISVRCALLNSTSCPKIGRHKKPTPNQAFTSAPHGSITVDTYEVWVRETKSARIGQTVFFKHKYLTQPRMTETDALIRDSDELCTALQNAAPESNAMETAVNALMQIFSGKAKDVSTATDARREIRAKA